MREMERSDASLRDAVGILSIAAGVLHASVVQEHAEEAALFGAFFVVAALAQGVWGSLLLNGPAPQWVLTAGALGNLAIVGVWIVSRTAGLPLGREPGVAEVAGFLDLLTTSFEVLAIAGALALLRGRVPRVPIWAVGLAVAALSGAALLTAPAH